MAKMSTQTHIHASAPGATVARLRLALGLTVAVLLVEVLGGLMSHSLALLADAGHVLTDVIALAIAWFAAIRATKPADARNTYGYHRTGILAALANAVTLILIVGWIGYEAVARLQHPAAVTPGIMIAAASVGLVVNLGIGLSLHGGDGHQHAHNLQAQNLNVRGAMLHALGDAAASAGVILGALVILATGWRGADPLISLGIALLIAKNAWDLLGEAVDILMEATPRDLNVAQLVRDLVKVPGVSDVHDLHIWSIAGGMRILSAHVQVQDNQPLGECDHLLDRLHTLLCERYAIQHTTFQLECTGCEQQDLYCALPEGEHAHAHDHHHE